MFGAFADMEPPLEEITLSPTPPWDGNSTRDAVQTYNMTEQEQIASNLRAVVFVLLGLTMTAFYIHKNYSGQGNSEYKAQVQEETQVSDSNQVSLERV